MTLSSLTCTEQRNCSATRSWPTHFSAQFSFSQHFAQRTAAFFVFLYDTVLDDLFQIVACFHTAEQCSATNNLSTASALQLSKSDLCNFKLCVTFVNMQKLPYSYLSAFATCYMPFTLTMFRYDCIIANFAKTFLESAGVVGKFCVQQDLHENSINVDVIDDTYQAIDM